jgi:hypothetical protein
MLRIILGVIAGLAVWLFTVTILNLGLRHGWPAYAAVEKAMAFTVPMMAARLTMSALASLAAGIVASAVARGRIAPLIAGLILLGLFASVHYGLWERFPLWYHLTFLISLVALPVLAAIPKRPDA